MTKDKRSEFYQFAIYRVLDDNNMSIFEPVPTGIINKTVIYDSKNNYRLFYCQVPEEYGNSISSKRRYKLIRQW